VGPSPITSMARAVMGVVTSAKSILRCRAIAHNQASTRIVGFTRTHYHSAIDPSS
jgi:hypothetical protein